MAAGGNGNTRVTVGEIGRRLDRLEADFHDGLQGLHRRLDELSFITPETFTLQNQLEAALRADLERRIGTLESNNQWLWRTIAGIVLTALIAAALAAAGLPQ